MSNESKVDSSELDAIIDSLDKLGSLAAELSGGMYTMDTASGKIAYTGGSRLDLTKTGAMMPEATYSSQAEAMEAAKNPLAEIMRRQIDAVARDFLEP